MATSKTVSAKQALPPAERLRSCHPFSRLTRLLADQQPGAEPINMAIGEPQGQPPGMAALAIARNSDQWFKYPPWTGTEAYRGACVNWLNRRYGLPVDRIDPARHIVPCPGSREGLFFAALAAVRMRPGPRRPVVLVPSPGYHAYAAAAIVAGAEPVFLPATAETGHLPDLGAIGADVLKRTVLAFLCSPANPQGASADSAYWRGAIELARANKFVLVADECYAEIYDTSPPDGILQAAEALGGALDNIVAFHSLSKRSNAPGLRCGFAVGDEDMILSIGELGKYGGAGVSLPILSAGTRLWDDDTHVERIRAGYRASFDIADAILGHREGYSRPAAGFFLWLDVGDGEAAALALWREAGVRVLPGGYMAETDEAGNNPGERFIRVALVHDRLTIKTALERLNEVL